jgi:hypothetical protein
MTKDFFDELYSTVELDVERDVTDEEPMIAPSLIAWCIAEFGDRLVYVTALCIAVAWIGSAFL